MGSAVAHSVTYVMFQDGPFVCLSSCACLPEDWRPSRGSWPGYQVSAHTPPSSSLLRLDSNFLFKKNRVVGFLQRWFLLREEGYRFYFVRLSFPLGSSFLNRMFLSLSSLTWGALCGQWTAGRIIPKETALGSVWLREEAVLSALSSCKTCKQCIKSPACWAPHRRRLTAHW